MSNKIKIAKALTVIILVSADLWLGGENTKSTVNLIKKSIKDLKEIKDLKKKIKCVKTTKKLKGNQRLRWTP